MFTTVFMSEQPEANDDIVRIYNYATGKVEAVSRIVRTDSEWRKLLSPEQYDVMRLKGTERPFEKTCALPPTGQSGFYLCAGCETALFVASAKFESNTGWPSFWEPISDLNVRYVDDNSYGMRRTEVCCARCGSHLGHVFDDGPPPSGKRYCINSVTLKLQTSVPLPVTARATFAAGCFWGVESAFRQLIGKGVLSTRVGYTGGSTKNPTYEQVCSHTTGHAEAVEVEYNPDEISYEKLLELFWKIHDPTTPDRQGLDIGSNYRSAIFYHTPDQKTRAEKSRDEIDNSGRFDSRVVTEIKPAETFWPAEDYHQQFYEKKGVAPRCNLNSER